MKFSPDGRAPNAADILRAAHHSPVIRACLTMAERGQMTPEQSLIAMILSLADQNEMLHNQLVESTMTQRTVYIKEPS